MNMGLEYLWCYGTMKAYLMTYCELCTFTSGFKAKVTQSAWNCTLRASSEIITDDFAKWAIVSLKSQHSAVMAVLAVAELLSDAIAVVMLVWTDACTQQRSRVQLLLLWRPHVPFKMAKQQGHWKTSAKFSETIVSTYTHRRCQPNLMVLVLNQCLK